MIERVRGGIATFIARFKGKSHGEAENKKEEPASNLAPTKRYEAIKSKGNTGQEQALLLTDAGAVYLRPGFLVGRGASCNLKLADPKASRVHASFTKVDGGWLLQDNASKNGTFVNGRRIQKTLLKTGDSIQIGQTVLGYEER